MARRRCSCSTGSRRADQVEAADAPAHWTEVSDAVPRAGGRGLELVDGNARTAPAVKRGAQGSGESNASDNAPDRPRLPSIDRLQRWCSGYLVKSCPRRPPCASSFSNGAFAASSAARPSVRMSSGLVKMPKMDRNQRIPACRALRIFCQSAVAAGGNSSRNHAHSSPRRRGSSGRCGRSKPFATIPISSPLLPEFGS